MSQATVWRPVSRGFRCGRPGAAPAPGDMVTVTAGCDKAFETCSAKFANTLNFQGFPHLPGSDFAYGYADSGTVHDGRPIVP
jgi:uncharacterized phage protein (TIGR02218 family)